jgi:hypothetical protein
MKMVANVLFVTNRPTSFSWVRDLSCLTSTSSAGRPHHSQNGLGPDCPSVNCLMLRLGFSKVLGGGRDRVVSHHFFRMWWREQCSFTRRVRACVPARTNERGRRSHPPTAHRQSWDHPTRCLRIPREHGNPSSAQELGIIVRNTFKRLDEDSGRDVRTSYQSPIVPLLTFSCETTRPFIVHGSFSLPAQDM